jgi:DNA polymerase-3 subunit delta'
MILRDTIRHQETALAALNMAWQSGRVPHASLFWGPEGVGKMRTALGWAQQLFCTDAHAPCGACSACQRVTRLTYPDLHVVLAWARGGLENERQELDAYAQDAYHWVRVPRSATIGIERIRSLKLEASKARVERGARMILIRDAERMTLEAAQAALKLIEEPQAETFLVLTCTDPSHLLPTILSRCQRVRFRALPNAFLEEVLCARMELPAAQARVVAGLAQGSLSRALELGESDALALRDEALALIEAPARDAAEASSRVQRLGRAWDGERARVLVDLMMTWYSDLLATMCGLPAVGLVHGDRIEELRRQASSRTLNDVKRRIAALEEMLQAIEQNVNPALALEAALLKIHGLAE